jgi:hypothetical protein
VPLDPQFALELVYRRLTFEFMIYTSLVKGKVGGERELL